MIRLEKATYMYPGSQNPALENISLELNRGEFTVIMGRNGSGKSTLALLLNGLLTPQFGRVQVDGLDTANSRDLNSIRKKVGLLLSEPDSQLVSNLVEEEVAFGPENIGLPAIEIRQRVDDALKMVSMEDYKKYPPYLLSGGQKQRVCIAGLLALQPQYMVMDEPTSMLDPKSRKEVMETLWHLYRKMDITLILITHNLEDAIQADRIIVLDSGKVQFAGKPAQVISDWTRLMQAGIGPLEVTSLIRQLNQDEGLNIAEDILNIEQLVNELCRLK